VLLDALVRRLGEGLSTTSEPRPRNEEEEIGADEEDGGELPRKAPDHEALAKACRSKVQRLIKRMQKQFERAAEPDRARRAVVQLAAVLGIVRALRLVEQRSEWRRKRLELITRDDEWRLLDAGVLALTWGPSALGQRALDETGGELFGELSFAIGLLGWLAWDVGIDVEVLSERGGRRGVEEEGWYGAQIYALLAPWLVNDTEAISVLEQSVPRTPRPHVDGDRWWLVHLGLAQRLAELAAGPTRVTKRARVPRPGDLLWLSERFMPRVRVALDVVPTSGDMKVVVFDAEDETLRREFLASRIVTLPWEPERPAKLASA
jgi:hypothetical protein